MIRIFRVTGMKFKPDMPVKFDGKIVGKTINSNEIMVDNDDVYRMIRSNEASFSLEVVHK